MTMLQLDPGPVAPEAANPIPTKAELFAGFFKTGISGFGGVLPHARHMLVENRRWLTDRQFTEVLSLGQGLPGPNIVNMSIVIGSRFHGWRGSLCAVSGLMLAPFVIVLLLASLYERFADSAMLNHGLTGVAAAAAGLILATSARLAMKMDRRPWTVVVMVSAFAAVIWLRLPLLAVLAMLAPISIALAWHDLKRQASIQADQQ